MPKKPKMVKIEVPGKPGDTPTVLEFTANEWEMVNAYFDENMNQTRAYLKIHPGANYDSAKTEACKFFTKPHIRAEIERRLKANAMSAEEVLSRLGDMARATHKPYIKVDSDGFAYFNLADPEAQKNMHLIKKMKTKRERRLTGRGKEAEEWEGEWVEVELHDAQAALEKIGKFHGMFIDNVKHEGEVTLNVRYVDKPKQTSEDGT
jgi:phage terminase small subunit